LQPSHARWRDHRIFSLIADAHGDLFGTTASGGAYDYGTVFEIVKTAHGYASTPPPWSVSTAPTVLRRSAACSPTPTATYSARLAGTFFKQTTARYLRSPAAASVPIRRLAIRWSSRTIISCSRQIWGSKRPPSSTYTTIRLIRRSWSSQILRHY